MVDKKMVKTAYSCLKKEKYHFKKYSIIPIRKKDIQSIRKWRNEQIDILRQTKKITKIKQIEYYERIIKKTFNQKKPNSILFSYCLEDKCIGYGGFVHINWNKKRAELSFLLDTECVKKKRIYKKEFSIFLKLLFRVNMEQTKFKTIFTETYDIRPTHITILEENDFKYIKKIKNSKKNTENKIHDSIFHEYVEILN